MTNLYLMKDGASGLHKIGISENPVFREKTLMSQSPLIELYTYWSDQSLAVERQLHTRFADKRKRGEWFDLERSDVDYIYFHFTDAERVDVLPPPEHLRIWCQLQTARLQFLRCPPESVVVVKDVIQTVKVCVDEPLSERLTRLYSQRPLQDMRTLIGQCRGKAKVEGANESYWTGMANGIVWASGVD